MSSHSCASRDDRVKRLDKMSAVAHLVGVRPLPRTVGALAWAYRTPFTRRWLFFDAAECSEEICHRESAPITLPRGCLRLGSPARRGSAACRLRAICSDQPEPLLKDHLSSHPVTEPPSTKTNLIRALFWSRDRSTRRSPHRGRGRRSSFASAWRDPRSRSDPNPARGTS